jgi:sterol desaturase/sphingolipid hydroxylase (fatty acid hydroxylase superfamily)
MLHFLWDTRGYFFWLLVISTGCLVAERIRPWRRGRKLFRKEFFHDLFWLFFNGHYFSVLFAYVAAFLALGLFPVLTAAKSWNLLGGWPIVAQFLVYFLLKDFLDWCVHNLLHRVPALWEFHKLHHSIVEMDWIGNFRFHWMEIIVYQGLTYFPLVILGVDPLVILLVAIASTLIGHLNHSNLDISWGPLRYLFNSSRMHIWHHTAHLPDGRPAGVNFGISLSVWDWMFHTAYWPAPCECPSQQPEYLGFPDMDKMPRSLPARFVSPLIESARTLRRSIHRKKQP